jgi:proteasome lid subunit RPN8/RPN11
MRESGAFLLQRPGSNKITDFICFDDLEPECLKGGYIYLTHKGFINLSKACKSKGMIAVADVHTHPSYNTAMSPIDIANPMIGIPGHIAMIIPSYAKRVFSGFAGVGIYQYEGARQWTKIK